MLHAFVDKLVKCMEDVHTVIPMSRRLFYISLQSLKKAGDPSSVPRFGTELRKIVGSAFVSSVPLEA